MNANHQRSTRARILLLAGLLLAGGLIVRNIHGPEATVGQCGLETPAKLERAHPGASRRATVSLTSDQLVAIHEKEGAAAALAAAMELTGPDRDSQVVFILTYLARIDPEWVAGQLAGAGLSVAHQGFVIAAVMDHWNDGAKALAWASSELTGDHRKTALGRALGILVRTDPAAALAGLDSIPPGGNHRQVAANLFSAWGGHDPEAALSHIAASLPPDERNSAIEYVLGSWARTDPGKAMAWAGSVQDEELRGRLISEVARNWYSVSPEETVAWVTSLTDETLKADILAKFSDIERVTIRCDFVGVSQAPDLGWKNKAVAEMSLTDLRNWVAHEPEAARSFLATAPPDSVPIELAVSLAAAMSTKEGPAATFEWAGTLSGDAAAQAMRLAVISWAGRDPEAAGARLESLDAEVRAPLASALAETWSRIDPTATGRWVAAREPGDQAPLVIELLQQWSDQDSHQAYAWLATLPPGDGRDEGISYLIRREASQDPTAVVPWIDLISRPELREKKRIELEGYLNAAEKGDE